MSPQLSKNFYLDEFTRSQTAVRHGINIIVQEGSEKFLKLQLLCQNILQPLRDEIGPITITSGYRPVRLNRLIGGSTNSQHCRCEAVDFVASPLNPFDICQTIIDLELPFDQLIHEFGRWVHVSFVSEGGRREVLTAYKQDRLIGKPPTLYQAGLHTIKSLTQEAF